MSPTHLSATGGVFFLFESVIPYAVLVRYSEFGGCPLFGSSKCIASTGMAVGTSMVVRYLEEVRYWEGPLSEVPLYTYMRGVSTYIHYFVGLRQLHGLTASQQLPHFLL